MTETKRTNPKDAIGATKTPFHLNPPIAAAEQAAVHLHGALKYGVYNWREAGVRTSIYIDAIYRHLMKFQEGEDYDDESHAHHLAHIMACCAIVLDSRALENLEDDRGVAGPYDSVTAANHNHRIRRTMEQEEDRIRTCQYLQE